MSEPLHERIRACAQQVSLLISDQSLPDARLDEAYAHLFRLLDCADEVEELQERLRPPTRREREGASRVRRMWRALLRTRLMGRAGY